MEKVKAICLKRVLGLPRNARNRLVLLMAATNSIVEEVAQDFHLPSAIQFQEYQKEISLKKSRIPNEFLSSPAMTQHRWKECNPGNRHLVTRISLQNLQEENFSSMKCTLHMCFVRRLCIRSLPPVTMPCEYRTSRNVGRIRIKWPHLCHWLYAFMVNVFMV